MATGIFGVSPNYPLSGFQRLTVRDPKDDTLIVRTVPYAERLGSPEFYYQQNQIRMRRRFLVQWEDRFYFTNQMMGYPIFLTDSALPPVGSGAGRYISRQVPVAYKFYQFPYDPGGRDVLYPTQVESMTGLGAREYAAPGMSDNRFGGDKLYEGAEITLAYEPLTYPTETDADIDKSDFGKWQAPSSASQLPDEASLQRYVTRIIRPLAQAVQLPLSYYRWAEGYPGSSEAGAQSNLPSNQTLIKIEVKAEVTYVWHQVPSMGYIAKDVFLDYSTSARERDMFVGAAMLYPGSVNDAGFDHNPKTGKPLFEPGTLLLTSVEARPYRLHTGMRVADYVYKMSHFRATDPDRPGVIIGQNHFLRYPPNPETLDPPDYLRPKYHKLSHNGRDWAPPLGENLTDPGDPVFPPRDFNDLFRPLTYDEILDKIS